MFKSVIFLYFVIIFPAGCATQQIGNMTFPEGKSQHVVRSEAMPWRSCPPGLPAGCKMAVLEGNPKKSDLFTVRFATSEALFLPAHTHPKDERVTVLKGKVAVGFGKDAKRQTATEFGPGDYYVNARHAVHAVWVEKGSVLQITGVGPWEVNFLHKK